jgi:hypothetical protein
MLRQDAPGEWQDHREEFIERPKADELGIIEMRRDRVSVHEAAPPSNRSALSLLRRGGSANPDQTVAVTAAVTIGTPVPAPTPTPTGIATWPRLKRPEARPTMPPARTEHGDDLAARAFEEAGEAGERGVEGRVGTGHRDFAAEKCGNRDHGCCLHKRRPFSFELVLHRIVPFLETASVIQGLLERTDLRVVQQLTIGLLWTANRNICRLQIRC